MVRSAFTNGIIVGAIVLAVVYVAYNYDPSLGGLLGRREGFVTTSGAAPDAKNTSDDAAKKAAADAAAKKAAADAAAKKATTDATTKTTTGTGSTPDTSIISNPTTATATPTAANPQGFRNGGSSNAKEGFADLASMEGPAAFASAEAPAGCYPRDQLTPIELLPADQNTIYAQQNPMGVGSLKGKNFLSAGALIGVNTVGQSLRNANLQLRSEPPNPQTPVSIFFQSTIGPDVSHRPLEVGA